MYPETMYTMAKQDHQARIAAASRRREVRAVQARREHNWLASIAARLRPAHGPVGAVEERGAPSTAGPLGASRPVAAI
jgi:hypothetical protein